jgi:multimeric flavodoxin WrbA
LTFACYACRDTGICAIKDDMAEVLQKIIDADVLVFASPVYFYSVDAQLKALIDRIVARWLEVKDKEFYYIVTATDEEKVSADTTIACFRGYADCVKGAKEMGIIYGMGVYEKGKVKDTNAMIVAYEMGKGV